MQAENLRTFYNIYFIISNNLLNWADWVITDNEWLIHEEINFKLQNLYLS